jgi:hypothetical protein
MKPVRLGELRELLHGAAFSAWWTEYVRSITALDEARLRYEDLLAHSEMMALRSELAQRAAAEAFSRAGEAEEERSRSGVEAQRFENRALELVGHHEEQRVRTSELWVRLGGAERTLEERREAIAALGPQASAKARAQAEAALQQAERQHQAAKEAYEIEDRRRAGLWEQVEEAWSGAFDRSLVGAEQVLASRRIHRDADRLFKEAEERRVRGQQLAADAATAAREHAAAVERRRALLAQTRQRFGCIAGEAFLYWRREGDERSAFAVALADDPHAGDVEVKALHVYTVGRQRGVASLAPAQETVDPSRDPEEGPPKADPRATS